MPANSGHNVDLLYDRPAATDDDLIFGADYVPPRNDVVVQATLPLPVVSVAFIPPARLEMQAELPGLTVSTLILRPSVPLNVGVASLPGVVLTGEDASYKGVAKPAHVLTPAATVRRVVNMTAIAAVEAQIRAERTP